MNITIFCCSPKQETSTTMQAAIYLQSARREDIYNLQMIGGFTSFLPANVEAISSADLVIFMTPIMQYGLPSQLMFYLENMVSAAKDVLQSKPFAFYFMGDQVFDNVVKNQVEMFFKNNDLKLISTLSQGTGSILSVPGQNEFMNWYTYIKSMATVTTTVTFTRPCNVLVLDVTDGSDSELNSVINNICSEYTIRGAKINCLALRNFNIQCCHFCEGCITSRNCVMQKTDDFERVTKTIYVDTNIIMVVGSIRHGMPSPIFKVWLDRHHQYGKTPKNRGIIWGYFTNDATTDEEMCCFTQYASARQAFDGDIFSGVDRVADIKTLINDSVIRFNCGCSSEQNFYALGANMIYQRNASELQNIAPQDYRYYAKKGAYLLAPPNPAYIPVYNSDAALAYRQNRLIPYQQMVNSLAFTSAYMQPQMGAPMSPPYNPM